MSFKKNNLFPFLLFLFLFSAVFALPALAITDYKLDMPLIQGQKNVNSLSQYIKMVFMFGLGMAGIAALFSVVWGGINYLTAGSSETRKLEGRRWIYAAISGIILLLFSYLIFLTLNSELVSLKEPSLEQNSQIGTQSSPFQLEMPLGNNQSPQNPGEYVKTFFIFGLGLVGIVALFGIIFGGVQYLLSAGNAALKTYGRQWIIASLSGLFLLLCSYLILATINPQLISLTLPPLDSPAPTTQSGSFQLEMPLSGSGQSTSDFTQYIKSFFVFALGLVGIVALFAIAFGGLNYIFSGSSQTRAMEGRRWITAAVSGLALLLLSFLILNTINPEIVSLQAPILEQPTQSGTTASPFQLEMPFFGVQQTNTTPGEYVKLFFLYGLGIVGVAALFGIAFGGLNYIFSGSSQTRSMEGKRWITAAVSGIALLLCSFLILITINPQLISLQNPKLETITIPPHLGLGYNTFNDLNQINNAPYSNTNLGSNAENAIQQAAQYYGISPNLIKAVMGVESGKNATALSPKGAQGLMQLMPGTAAEMGVRNSYDPVQNIWGGAGYIAKIINTYSRQYEFTPTAENVLRAYNAGPAAVEKSRSYKETNSYVNKLGKISGTSLENPLSANQRSSYKIPM